MEKSLFVLSYILHPQDFYYHVYDRVNIFTTKLSNISKEGNSVFVVLAGMPLAQIIYAEGVQ